MGDRRPGFRRYLAWVVLGGWVTLLAVASPAAGDLNAAQDNSTAAYAAPDAESTRVQTVLETQQRAPMSAVVVYERSAGITEADRARAMADASAFATAPGVPGHDRFGWQPVAVGLLAWALGLVVGRPSRTAAFTASSTTLAADRGHGR